MKNRFTWEYTRAGKFVIIDHATGRVHDRSHWDTTAIDSFVNHLNKLNEIARRAARS